MCGYLWFRKILRIVTLGVLIKSLSFSIVFAAGEVTHEAAATGLPEGVPKAQPVMRTMNFGTVGTVDDWAVTFEFLTRCERNHYAVLTDPSGSRMLVMMRGNETCTGLANIFLGTTEAANADFDAFDWEPAQGDWEFRFYDLEDDALDAELKQVSLELWVDESEGADVIEEEQIASSLPQSIPVSPSVTRELTFEDPGIVEDATLDFEFTTSCERDLLATLESPSKRIVTVMNGGNGTCSGVSEQSLAHDPGLGTAFSGEQIQGEWIFKMYDLFESEYSTTLDSINLSLNTDAVRLSSTIDMFKSLITDGDVGERFGFEYFVRNDGSAMAENVLVRVEHSGGLTDVDWTCFGVSGDAQCNEFNAVGPNVSEFTVDLPPGRAVGIEAGGVLENVNVLTVDGVASPSGVIPGSDNVAVDATVERDPGEGDPLADNDVRAHEVNESEPSRDTIVFTHGLLPSSPCLNALDTWTGSLPYQAAGLVNQKILDSDVPVANVVSFFWDGACKVSLAPNGFEYEAARRNGRDAGERLARDLEEMLGRDYAGRIQFVGHSLGTVVNAYAANLVLRRMTNVTEAQFTVLDHPSRVHKLALPLLAKSIKASFFEDLLPFDRTGLSLRLDNYYAKKKFGDIRFFSAGVGEPIEEPADRVCNRALEDPHEVGSEFLPKEEKLGFSNDHSGVQQWYRWSIEPRDGEGFSGNTVCDIDDWSDGVPPDGVNGSLLPCVDGWNVSVVANPGSKLNCQNVD